MRLVKDLKGSGKNLVISPVYNEEENLEKYYSWLREHYQGDVLFINDGSIDNSADLIKSFKGSGIFIINHPERSGYGAAQMSAFKFACENGYFSLISVDSDLQHNPVHIRGMLDALNECEVVLGSRYLKKHDASNIPRDRFVINRYITAVLKNAYSVNITDPFCGMRAYRTSFLKKLKLDEKSYGFALEILMQIIKSGLEFREYPIDMIYFDEKRMFHDGLNDPAKRLKHYMNIIYHDFDNCGEFCKILSGIRKDAEIPLPEYSPEYVMQICPCDCKKKRDLKQKESINVP
jgi:glycosyltransferase involved in cell wall biosynthesis